MAARKIIDQICCKCGKKYRDSSNRKSGCGTCRLSIYPCLLCDKKIKKKEGTCRTCLNQNFPPGFKGGRIQHKAGYVMVKVAKDHPRAGRNSGYVFEHILVMEDFLGRSLEPFENVHHKNGVRSDNSLSNLELWCKPQPSGQRVEDLIQWLVDNYREKIKSLL